MTTLDCKGKPTREINQEIRKHVARGEKEITLANPEARHNLGVAIVSPVKLVIQGSAGYYCGGMGDGPTIEIHGSAGWGLAECMLSGTVVVDDNAGNSTAASIRGGTVVIRGDAGARAGISMKGGTLIIQGNCGYMTGFMMQKGTIVVCGDAGEALADSMYEGTVFVGGKIADLGNDAVISDPTKEDQEFLKRSLAQYKISAPRAFKKIVAGKKLWHFDKKERALWKEAL